MKLSEAKAIYRAKYWDSQRCDDLPAGVDYAIFDYGVNSGAGRSGKVLRRVLGLTDDTSVVTPGAAAGARDPGALVKAICDERLRFLQSLGHGNVLAYHGETGREATARPTMVCSSVLVHQHCQQPMVRFISVATARPQTTAPTST